MLSKSPGFQSFKDSKRILHTQVKAMARKNLMWKKGQQTVHNYQEKLTNAWPSSAKAAQGQSKDKKQIKFNGMYKPSLKDKY